MRIHTIFLFLIIGFFTSCTKDVTTITNEEELITTINYKLMPVGGGSEIILSFKDEDGVGGKAPVITGATLGANLSYTGTLELLNEATSPTDTITTEIEDEADAHQFFFSTNISGLNITYQDQDANNQPIGIKSLLTTGSAGKGSITVILRHEPDKFAPGVSSGDITKAGGETDIEVTFPVEVK